MSLAHFQDAMVRLITDPDFRDHIAAGHAATDATLSERETTRLQRIARDPGLGINRTLHKGLPPGQAARPAALHLSPAGHAPPVR